MSEDKPKRVHTREDKEKLAKILGPDAPRPLETPMDPLEPLLEPDPEAEKEEEEP